MRQRLSSRRGGSHGEQHVRVTHLADVSGLVDEYLKVYMRAPWASQAHGLLCTLHALHQENSEALDHQYVEHHLAPGGFDGRLCLEPSFFAENNLVPPTVRPRCTCHVWI